MYTYAIVTEAAKLKKPKIPAKPIPGIKKISATTRATPKTNRIATRNVYILLLFLRTKLLLFFEKHKKISHFFPKNSVFCKKNNRNLVISQKITTFAVRIEIKKRYGTT
jgi:hypothetical protein